MSLLVNILLAGWAEDDKSISGLIPTHKNLTIPIIALFKLFITGLRCAFFSQCPTGRYPVLASSYTWATPHNLDKPPATLLDGAGQYKWVTLMIQFCSILLSKHHLCHCVLKYCCDTVSSILSFNGKTEHLKLASENCEREQTRRSISEDGLLADLPLLMAAH